jgi:carbon storage regulator CsrA
MLVLSRKIGETLHVGDDVVIEIKRVSGSRVTIAIDAPRAVRILRGEIVEAATAFDEPVFDEPAFEEPSELGRPANLTKAISTPTTVTPTGTAALRGLVGEAVPVEPYLVSHPPVNPPGIAPGW